MSVDLDLFCDPERCAPGADLSVPFSLNGHTYATNGHIAVRVPRRPDIPENKEAPNAEERLPWDFSRIKFGPLPEPELLPDQCWRCDGRGHEHNARIVVANANTAMEAANSRHASGSARLFSQVGTSNGYRRSQGWRLESQSLDTPLPFRFKGGEGLLMPHG